MQSRLRGGGVGVCPGKKKTEDAPPPVDVGCATTSFIFKRFLWIPLSTASHYATSLHLPCDCPCSRLCDGRRPHAAEANNAVAPAIGRYVHV